MMENNHVNRSGSGRRNTSEVRRSAGAYERRIGAAAGRSEVRRTGARSERTERSLGSERRQNTESSLRSQRRQSTGRSKSEEVRSERSRSQAERRVRSRRQTRSAAGGLAALKPISGRDKVMLGVKVLMLVFLVVYIVQIYGMGQAKDVPLEQIEEKLTASTEVGSLTRGGVIDLKRSYSLSADDLAEFVLYSADSLMDVSELLIIKVKDTSQLPSVEEAVQRHLDTEKEKFDGYGTNQYDLLEHAIVLEKGPYLFFAVSENDKQWEEVFLSCVG